MIHHLRAAGISLVLDAPGTQVPVGPALGGRPRARSPADALDALAGAVVPAVPPSSIDVPLRLTLAARPRRGLVRAARPGGAPRRRRPRRRARATAVARPSTTTATQVLDVRTRRPGGRRSPCAPSVRAGARGRAAAAAHPDEHRRRPPCTSQTARRGAARARPGPRARSTSPACGATSAARSALLLGHGRVDARDAGTAAPATTTPTCIVAGHPRVRLPHRRGLGRALRVERRQAGCGPSAPPLGSSVLGGGELLAPGEMTPRPRGAS